MRAATATDIEDSGEIPVLFSISTRTNVTMCKATKKKIVGGSSSKNSFLSVVDSLVMELDCEESYRFHGSCSRIWLGTDAARVSLSKGPAHPEKKAGGLSEPPAVKLSLLLLARAFARRFRLGHLFRHLRFHGIKVETRTPLHRRVVEEGLEFLAHHLLDEHKAPELEFEPIEVLLRAVFRSVIWPALGLVDEAEFVVVNPHRAD